ncbi:NAD(P)-dependent oxidoreductase [Ancylobacter dichloromethanicus]|uniref:Epimerase n=1 Tax=Ancylobacter dichloromethanicus TaxID=518825 RepID=A0A9W6JDT5_9HYPH|nr:NAD(P)-dependent oxidoreductase [Ancylobacter dichloromethanicus]MBS7552160.1 NAD(P)-dependent oxidoreductase [Ancylobacter dichloromethanicus]GLK73894.1 epimerase [Ancylobacter dichloromethanicus]
MNGKAIIVFGGGGFIGSHLLRRLAGEEAGELISIDIRAPKIRVPGVSYLTHDVRDLSGLSFDRPIGRIYNLAAVHTTPGHETHEYYETNIRGATEVTAFARRHGVTSIVFTSSISVYGPSEEPKEEATPPQPNSAYGWSKWLAEGIHRAWAAENEDRRLVICRPAVIFGHTEGGNFTRLASLLRKGIFIYPGRTDTVKACFYVEDLLEAIAFAVSLDERYVLFNGCYPDGYTLEDIVTAFRQAHFTKARTFVIPRFLVLGLAMLLKPLSRAGLGIHPDRVMKLVRSTDIRPGWLKAKGRAPRGQLPSALERWQRDSAGRFD